MKGKFFFFSLHIEILQVYFNKIQIPQTSYTSVQKIIKKLILQSEFSLVS